MSKRVAGLGLQAALIVSTLALASCGGSREGGGTPQNPSPQPERGESKALAELPCLDAGALSGMHSSFSRAGLNNDFLTVADPVPHQRPHLYRDAQGRYVLLDVTGPGVIKRIWMTQLAPDTSGPGVTQGPLIEHGNIQFFLDDETTPRVDLPAQDFFSGQTAPFLAPLCGDNTLSSGGNYCTFSLPFARRAVIAVTGRPNYWDIEYDRYPADRAVDSFDPRSAESLARLDEQRVLLGRAGSDPGLLAPGATTGGPLTLAAGQEAVLYKRDGSGVVQALEVELQGDATLSDLWLEASWDGVEEPQIVAPLADLFMSGRGEKKDVLGLLAGFVLEQRRGYLYYPMPYRQSARLTLRNVSDRPATLNWRVVEAADKSLAERPDCGWFHATYAEQNPTLAGEDYILMNLTDARGKVVGLSLNADGPIYEGGLTTFLEGDERVHIDGSQRPQIYGTGMEDIFNGGFYYQNGPFTLPTHGLSARDDTERGRAFAQYRQLLFDAWSFRDSIRIGVEHGGGNGVPTENSSLVLWYGLPGSGLVLSDEIDVGDPASEQAHAYTSASLATLRLSSYYPGDRDGNLSAEAFDRVIFPGAVPGLNPDELVEDDGRYHQIGTVIGMQLTIDPVNDGVLLRRRLDAILFDQRAEVSVDGEVVGIWHWPQVNDSKRWADHDFLIPAAFSRGKEQISLSLEILTPILTPAICGLGADDLASTQISLPSLGILDQGGWSDFAYRAYSLRRR